MLENVFLSGDKIGFRQIAISFPFCFVPTGDARGIHASLRSVGMSASFSSHTKSASEGTTGALRRIRQLDRLIAAFVEVDEETAITEARHVDARTAKHPGHPLPLAGFTLAVRDMFAKPRRTAPTEPRGSLRP